MSELRFKESEPAHAMAATLDAGTGPVVPEASTLPGGLVGFILCSLALVALALASPCLFAQESSKTTAPNPMTAVLQLRLDHREGTVPLYYSACCRERALEIQEALQDFIAFYKKNLGISSPVSVTVIDADDWKRVAAKMPPRGLPPYGMTNVQPRPPTTQYVAFIPADDQGVITESQLADRPYANAATLNIFASVHLSYDEAARRFIRHPALHEVGHTLVSEYGIQTSSHWLNEMLASYFAYAYEKARDHETAAIVEGFTKMSSPPIAYSSLEDFETHMVMPPANYDWYQRQIEARIVEVYGREGIGFLAKVRTEFPKSTQDMSVTDTLTRLEAVTPGFEAWAEKLKHYKAPNPTH